MLGESISKKENHVEGVGEVFRKLTGRRPSQGELDVLLELRKAEYQKFEQHPEKLKGWLNAGDYQLSKNIDPVELASNAVVASTIINADATIMKR